MLSMIRIVWDVPSMRLAIGKPVPGYAWPGNVRELRSAVERGVILAAGPVVALADVPSRVASALHSSPGAGVKPRMAGKPTTIVKLAAEHIRHILTSTTSLREAAAKLGIDPSTLYRKRKKYGI